MENEHMKYLQNEQNKETESIKKYNDFIKNALDSFEEFKKEIIEIKKLYELPQNKNIKKIDLIRLQEEREKSTIIQIENYKLDIKTHTERYQKLQERIDKLEASK